MFIQNLKYAYRHLSNNRFYSILNIMGLSLGLGISLIIYFIILQETTFDRLY
jgi:hypothetical protein